MANHNFIIEVDTGNKTVRVGDAESATSAVKSRVPQGSVLFDMFIDDLDEFAELLEILVKFADDVKGMKEIAGIEDKEKLQQTLDQLVSWAETWGLQFSFSKCKIMHVGKKNPEYEYYMAGHRLTVFEEEKDVGAIVHKSLKPSRQCKKAAVTAGAVLRKLTRNFHYRDRNIFKKLYRTICKTPCRICSPSMVAMA